MKLTRTLSLTMALALTLVLGLSAAALAAAPAVDGKELYAAKCASCHGADGSKALLSKPVKGLSADDITKKMLGYKAKTYGGAKKATMENLSSNLSAADIKAVAAFIAKL
ncbi:MAG: c-type cytochrome [Humidesulfovibrio sp.]|nr:c-type cytochrome [Humidesulfovibrio sp.]